MSSSSHLKALLKKNLLVSRRTFILTLIEILAPIIIILCFLGLKSLFETENLPITDDGDFYENNTTDITLNFKRSQNQNERITLYRGVLYQCSSRPMVALIGEDFPQSIITRLLNHLWEIPYGIFIRFYPSLESLYDYMQSDEYATDDDDLYPGVCFAISHSQSKNKYNFKIHYYASYYTTDFPDIPSTNIDSLDPYSTQPDFDSYEKYINSGFLVIQKMLYDYVLREETGKENATIGYIITAQKFKSFINDPMKNYISMLFGFFMVIAYALPLTINIYRLVKEKESKSKEGMKIMGLNELTYFLSYFIIYFILNLVYAICNTIIMKKVITTFESIYLFIFFFLFGLTIYGLIYFFQSFLERTRIAIIVSLLIYCIMYFFGLPIYSNAVSRWIKILFSVLFPLVNLQLGVNTISVFQENNNKFNGRIYMKYDKFSVFDMYIILIVNFLLYMFLGFYIQNIISHEYGIKKPWYFLFTKNFWGCGENQNKKDVEENSPTNTNEQDKILKFSTIASSKISSNNTKTKNNNNNENMNDGPISINDIKINNNILNSSNKLNNIKKITNIDNNVKINDVPILENELNFNKGDLNSKNKLKKKKNIKNINNIDNNEEIKVIPISMNIINNENLNSKNVLNDIKNNDDEKSTEANENFESEEMYKEYKRPGDSLKIYDIHKTFEDGKEALKGVSFNLYKNEIYALLGHNGAGKSTLINILTGLYPATSGKAIYNNENILSSEGHDKFRKVLGICPQQNVLFGDLTVEEHLEMFCVFKSVKSNLIKNEVTKAINDFGLQEKRYTKANDLSGGQKRKLSIAIAVVGGSSVIFLDEPTSGMDITSRRNLWDILKRYINDKIIILTTHYMEEASVLGNRIGILSEGDMKCIGSPLFLIEKFGKNINLNVTKEKEADNDQIIKFINDISGINENLENEIFSEEILFRIPKDDKLFNGKEFFKKLDSEYKKLKIKTYSISMSTLEDVFINVSKLIKKKKNENYDEEEKLDKEKLEKNNLILYNEDNYHAKYSAFSKVIRDTKVSLKKRFVQVYRDKKTFFLEILCPIILTLIGCLVSSIEFLEKNKNIPFLINQITNDSQVLYFSYSNPEQINKLAISDLQKYSYEPLSNIQFKYLKFNSDENDDYYKNIDFMNLLYNEKYNTDNENLTNYGSYLLTKINKEDQTYQFSCFVDVISRQSAPIYVDYMAKSLIRYATDNENLEIEVLNEPLPYIKEEIKNKQSRNSSMLIIFISIAFTLIPANFITIIIKERENNSKHLQLISGISLLSYWSNNYIFELLKYYVIGGICILLLYLFDFYKDYIYILYLEYGPAMISFTYLCSLLFKSEGLGQTIIIIINLVIGALGGTALLLMRTYDKLIKYAKPIIYVFRIIPSFCFCYGYNELLFRRWLFWIDIKIDNEELDDTTATLYSRLLKKDKDILDIKYIICDFIYLAVESVGYLLLLAFYENSLKIFSCCFTNKKKNKNRINTISENNPNIDVIDINNISIPENVQDTFVKNEIKKAKNPNDKKNYAIKIQSLVKTYYGGPFGLKIFEKCFKSTKAVREISLCLDYGECFGFLGVNGAGKTTTFKCLSNEIFPTSGNIFLDNKEINTDFDKVRSLIGYCPQFDAIFEYLTVYENLEFYGLIKGAKKEKINDIINALIEEMNLSPFKNKVAGTLSGGNKRKLSVSIAMICNPPIILLDEPSTGMDPEARRYMWGVIHRISINQKKSTIIMTTHSMEEAETLCKRIGILVDGQFKCLSTSDGIKEKYGYGYEINLQINSPDINELYLTYNIINDEDKNIMINLDNLDEILNKFGLEKYLEQLKKDLLGGKIVQEIESCGNISIGKILSWIYYMQNSLKMIKIILEYFPEVRCCDYGENNFVFKIKRNKTEEEKSIGFLFGLIEDYKSKFNIEQYFLQLTSLEQIFNKFARELENDENAHKNNEIINIDIPITKELIDKLASD